MGLQEKITNDMRAAITGGNKERLNVLRFVVGEFSHIPSEELGKYPNKELPDERVIAILKKCIANESSLGQPDENYVKVLESYLPAQASDQEIVAWIESNINFTDYKNKMQAIKPILAKFAGRADGNTIKTILDTLP